MWTYTEILTRNIKAARARAGLSQRDTVDRMRALGFTGWHPPTLGNVERGERGLRAEELLGLAYCLEITAERLMMPWPEDGDIELAPGTSLPGSGVRLTIAGVDPGLEKFSNVEFDRAVARGLRWDGNTPDAARS
jgi:transcriptional regulator with XRE-family HTH domain